MTNGIFLVVFVMIFFIIGYWGLNIGTGIFFQGQDNQIPSEARVEYTIDKKVYFVSGLGGVYKNGLKIQNFEALAGKNIAYKQLYVIPLFGIQYFNIQYLNGKISGIVPTLAIESTLKILPDNPTLFIKIRMEEIFDGKMDVDIVHFGIGIGM